MSTATSVAKKPFMLFWREWPSQRYVSRVIEIPSDVVLEKFVNNYLQNCSGPVNFLGNKVAPQKYNGPAGFSLLLAEEIRPDKAFLWRVTWEDYKDHDTKITQLQIPVAEDPNTHIHEWLTNLGDLAKYGFFVRSIERV